MRWKENDLAESESFNLESFVVLHENSFVFSLLLNT